MSACKSVIVRTETKFVLPEYNFPEPPDFPDVELIDYPYYKIDGNYFKVWDAYITRVEAVQREYEIDKEVYSKVVVEETDGTDRRKD